MVSNGGARRRFLALRDQWEAGAPGAVSAEADSIKDRVRTVARERITRPSSGGYIDQIESTAVVNGPTFLIEVRPAAPHSHYVEDGRSKGRPVTKPYKNKPGSYVAYYTGMPPPGIFGDVGNDWPMRNKIARDGIPPRHILATVRAEYPAALVMARILSRLRR